MGYEHSCLALLLSLPLGSMARWSSTYGVLAALGREEVSLTMGRSALDKSQAMEGKLPISPPTVVYCGADFDTLFREWSDRSKDIRKGEARFTPCYGCQDYTSLLLESGMVLSRPPVLPPPRTRQ